MEPIPHAVGDALHLLGQGDARAAEVLGKVLELWQAVAD